MTMMKSFLFSVLASCGVALSAAPYVEVMLLTRGSADGGIQLKSEVPEGTIEKETRVKSKRDGVYKVLFIPVNGPTELNLEFVVTDSDEARVVFAGVDREKGRKNRRCWFLATDSVINGKPRKPKSGTGFSVGTERHMGGYAPLMEGGKFQVRSTIKPLSSKWSERLEAAAQKREAEKKAKKSSAGK